MFDMMQEERVFAESGTLYRTRRFIGLVCGV